MRALLALALAGCGGPMSMPPVDETPPRVCRSPPPLPASRWFTEVTAEVGASAILAGSVRAGDLDGDGYPDLLVVGAGAERETEGKRGRFLLMNRPSGVERVLVDTTFESGILSTRDGEGGFSFGGANFGDVDNDGDVDVVASPGGKLDDAAVLLNDGAARFTLGPRSALDQEVSGITPASTALLDYDRDGVLDYFPATFAYPPPNKNRPLLLRGTGGGRFVEVTEEVGIAVLAGDPKEGKALPAMYGVTACDLDLDGDQDLLFADYGRAFNLVYLQEEGRFVESGKALGVWSDDRMDFSDDQSYRCYCANRPGTCKPAPPAPEDGICDGFGIPGGMDGRGWQPGYSDQPLALGGNTFSITCGDLDDDGDMDLMTAEIRHGDVGSASDPSEILWNDAAPGGPLGKFRRPGNMETGIHRKNSGIFWNEGDMTPVFVDLDNDGMKDIYLASSDYPGNHGWVWRQKEQGQFVDATKASGIGQPEAHGVAFADLDRDGDLDAFIGTSTFRGGAKTAAFRVWRNEVGQDANWLQVRLVGKGAGGANGSAIGALVRVTAGGRTQQQEVSGGYGHTTTQSDLVLHFGLGAECAVEKVEVRWPNESSTVSTFTDVRANYRVQLTEGETKPKYLLP